MFLLDTNHCSRIIFGDPVLLHKLEQNNDVGVATSTIVGGELLYMVSKSQRRDGNLKAVAAFLDVITQYPVNSDVAEAYGALKGRLFDYFGPKQKAKRRKFTIQDIGFSDNDLWIAATAIACQLTLVSADKDFQRVQEVQSLPLICWLS